jgi:beta-phosphoglucomutase-like phosphatase (HAD superfamily)
MPALKEAKNLIPEDVKALIFDCDGTLLDTMPLHWKAWCQICEETGLSFNKKDFLRLAGVPGKYIIRDLAIQQSIILDPLEVYQRKRTLFLKGISTVKSIPCVLRFVHAAKAQGIPLAVASGSSRAQVEKGRYLL